MADVAKCEAVLDHIRMNPETHEQRYWGAKKECGTAYCFAGWTCVLNGNADFEWKSGKIFGCDDANEYADEVAFGDTTISVRGLAKILLDLTWQEADTLFAAENTVDDLEIMVKNLANGDPITKNVPDLLVRIVRELEVA